MIFTVHTIKFNKARLLSISLSLPCNILVISSILTQGSCQEVARPRFSMCFLRFPRSGPSWAHANQMLSHAIMHSGMCPWFEAGAGLIPDHSADILLFIQGVS